MKTELHPRETPIAIAIPNPHTPGLLLGPYYPVARPQVSRSDLWHGTHLRSEARRLHFAGHVTDVHGRPVQGAFVELWHADPAGIYRHPSAPSSDCVLSGFAGYGCVWTDQHGYFAFLSLVPGAYTDRNVERAPHLHLQITGRLDRLVTQVFLPNHPANPSDRWYRSLRRPELLTARIEHEDGESLRLGWDAVLTQG